jgi:hypothetical protein
MGIRALRTLIRDDLIDTSGFWGRVPPLRAENGATTPLCGCPRRSPCDGRARACDVAAATCAFHRRVRRTPAALAAAEFRGVPYVFGDAAASDSMLRIDKCGLRRAVLTLHADAASRFSSASSLPRPWHLTGLEPGDLLIFIDESGGAATSPQAFSLGESVFYTRIAARVHVSSLDPADPPTAKLALSFVFARRPMP